MAKYANFVLKTKKHISFKDKSKQLGQPRNDFGDPVFHHGWSGGLAMNLGLTTALLQVNQKATEQL